MDGPAEGGRMRKVLWEGVKIAAIVVLLSMFISDFGSRHWWNTEKPCVPDTVTVIAWEPVPPIIIYADPDTVVVRETIYVDRSVVFYP